MRTLAHPVPALLAGYSWPAVRLHAWRYAVALLAVTIGVALAYAVALINGTALDEFSRAVRSVSGQPDLSLVASRGRFDESAYPLLARRPEVAQASPVLEAPASARQTDTANASAIQLVGVDALRVATLAPDLMPRLSAGQDRLALFAPDHVFLNASARALWPGSTLQLQRPDGRWHSVRIAGSITAQGPPLAVLDLGVLQDFLDHTRQLSRIDIRLQPATDAARLTAAWPAPPATLWSRPADAQARASNMSSAYRVNLSVLSLVALFTGAFLVYSALSLSVAQRQQQLALLGVLGLTPSQRLHLILLESSLLGVCGSLLGLLLGTLLAALALHLLGTDLGGGYFIGGAGGWQLPGSTPAAVSYAGLGWLAALAGGWWPAREVAALPLARTLKGLGSSITEGRWHRQAWRPLLLLALAAALCLLPAWGNVPLAAYLAIALLLLGGIGLLPALLGLLTTWLARPAQPRLLLLLAVERARRVRHGAAIAVSGVVCALAMSVALTVMVASFRYSVMSWLDVVLPAELYLRVDRQQAPQAQFDAAQIAAIGALDGVRSVQATRQLALQLAADRPAVTVLARDFRPGADAAARATASLPLVGTLAPIPPDAIPVYVSETFAQLYQVAPGDALPALAAALDLPVRSRPAPELRVAGVWRDYARQQGSVAIERNVYQQLSGDPGANELALTFATPAMADQAATRRALWHSLQTHHWSGPEAALVFADATQLRRHSLRIFDRSFAVTYWLQAVAIGMGLFGIASTFASQTLARRKEFGVLRHLGLTRVQLLAVVASESVLWSVLGCIAGAVLGLGISLILVDIVNPQSFHWSMDLSIPWPQLAALGVAVMVAGTLTAWLAGVAAADPAAVRAVKEDW